MLTKFLLLVAFGAGYVAGARAGRARYEQIRATAMRFKNDPRVQQRAHEAADVVREGAHHMAEHAKDHLPGLNGSAAHDSSVAMPGY